MSSLKYQLNDIFVMFANCIPVKGYKRSIIYNLQYSDYLPVPNSMIGFVEMLSKMTIEDVLRHFKNDHETALSYLEFLINNGLGQIIDGRYRKHFTPMSMSFHTPSSITNAVIDIKDDFYINKKIIDELSVLNSHTLQIRCFHDFNMKMIERILNMVNSTSIFNIQIFITENTQISKPEIDRLLSRNPRIEKLIVFNSKRKNNKSPAFRNFCHFVETALTPNDCGKISPAYFITSISLFTESQHHNTCLNRKVCIDINGDIKNCPAMSRSFGNIRDTSIAQAIAKPGFKDLWNIRKDDIEVCRDCEFRYMCTDCRTFIKDEKNIYSQPSKCTYNPYIAKWQGEEGYISIEDMPARE
ncbi:MAG: grasp-with-spasm system SPASM domain peptide maturase [Bacteroidota bacterium]